jgi:hypothetical protein
LKDEWDFVSLEGRKEIQAQDFRGARDFLTESWFKPSTPKLLRCFLQYQIIKLLQQQVRDAT